MVDVFLRRRRVRYEIKEQAQQDYALSDLHSSAVFSALPLRSLRLWGDWSVAECKTTETQRRRGSAEKTFTSLDKFVEIFLLGISTR
jgi:hypothetical protein